MPLHEYLEEKRRRNIAILNASGACHICGSTGRNSRGFSHFFDGANVGAEEAGGGAGAGHYNECSMVPRPQLAAMRTCACFGQSPGDPDFWPYSLRVCDKCIEDDRGIGRIRNCGVCGIVACDENCGAELVECTDCAEWNNAGCLECRRLVDFSEIPLFRSAPPRNRGGKRITRVCVKCLERSTPWVKHDFPCRRIGCETMLVPSDIVEMKRCTLASSPLNLLPEDGLVAVVHFLSGTDLRRLFFTSSAMCTVAERVAKEKVERVSGELPSGPVVSAERKKCPTSKNWTCLLGKNDFPLRAPDDGKAWVGVYNKLERIVKEAFCFDFQMRGDRDAVNRFINSREEKFTFGPAYSEVGDSLVQLCPGDLGGYSIRGGTVLVLEGEDGGVSLASARPTPLVVASDKPLASGPSCVICRIFCPGSGGDRSNANTRSKLGSVGLIRNGSDGASWVQRTDINEAWLSEDVVFGVRYDTASRELVVHSNSHITPASRFASSRHMIEEAETGELRIALELARSSNCAMALLSVRYCNEAEWVWSVEQPTNPAEVIRPMVATLEANAGQVVDPAQANPPPANAAQAAAPQVYMNHALDMFREQIIGMVDIDEDLAGMVDIEEELAGI